MMDAHRTIQSPLPVQLAEFDEPRTPLLPVIAVILTVILGALLGWLFGGHLAQDPPVAKAPSDRIAAVGPLRLDVDGDWTPTRATGALTQMDVKDIAVFAPAAGLPGRTWVARARADGPTLVPASVRARLAAPLGPPQRASMAGRAAWSYGTVALRDGGRLELAVLPTDAGVLLVGCEAQLTWWSTVAGCTRAIRAVGGAAAIMPGPDLAFRERVRTVVPALNQARSRGAKRLARARTPGGQRREALKLATAHATAAAALAPVTPAGGPARKVLGGLRATAGAYAALGAAAGEHARARYVEARKRVRHNEAALRTALRRSTA
jgi:hypothetical protein